MAAARLPIGSEKEESHKVKSPAAREHRSVVEVPTQAAYDFDQAAARLARQNRFEGAEGASEIEMLEQSTGMSRGR